MSNEWKVVPGHYPGFLNIVGASFDVSIVTVATDLSFEDYCNRARDAHIMAAAKDLLIALEAVVLVADRATGEFDLARAAIAKARRFEL